MEKLPIEFTGKSFEVKGIPGAAKMIEITGPKAKKIADLGLHAGDLGFAMECLQTINSTESEVARRAMWEAAVVHFMKCFGGNQARSSLHRGKIYGSDKGANIAFDYFFDLRHKHVVHDENSWSQSLPGAVLNGPNNKRKIELVTTLNLEGSSMAQANYSNLHQLISVAQTWVGDAYDKLCESIRSDLEELPYDELVKRKTPIYRAPAIEEISVRRFTP